MAVTFSSASVRVKGGPEWWGLVARQEAVLYVITVRIIAGRAKGRRLKSPRGMAVRPTADRVKEALFSMLASRFDLAGAVVLDLFAGTGGMGLEALSRGASQAVFVEESRPALAVLRDNVNLCGFADRAELMGISVRRALGALASRGPRFDGVFADPPYGRGLLPETLEQLAGGGLLRRGAWVMVEGRTDDDVNEKFGPLRLTQSRCYGKTKLMLFQLMEVDGRGVAD